MRHKILDVIIQCRCRFQCRCWSTSWCRYLALKNIIIYKMEETGIK